MKKKAVERLAEDVASLRVSGFDSLAEVAVFLEVAIATLNSKLRGVTEISRAVKLPNSTVSRHIWALSQRGLLEYTSDAKDRRIRLIRARLDVFGERAKTLELPTSAGLRSPE